MPIDCYSLGYNDGFGMQPRFEPNNVPGSEADYAIYCTGYRDGWADRHYNDVYDDAYDDECGSIDPYDDFENDF